jgi:hypothetical protein
MFEQTGNGGLTSPDTLRFMHYFEYIKRIQDADPTMKLTRQQQMVQQQYAFSGDHGVLPGFMVDSAFPLLPASDQIRPGDCGLMRCPSGMRKFGNFSNHIPTLLEQFKSNKTKCYELSEIAGHVVEFRCVNLTKNFRLLDNVLKILEINQQSPLICAAVRINMGAGSYNKSWKQQQQQRRTWCLLR